MILAQHRLCLDQGARGSNFFALDGTAANPVPLLTEPLIEALRNGPFAGHAAAYRPPPRSRAELSPCDHARRSWE